MQLSKIARYRGHRIALRSDPAVGSIAQRNVFIGLYRLDPNLDKSAGWEEVGEFVFHTSETAEAHALAQARKVIDRRLGAARA